MAQPPPNKQRNTPTLPILTEVVDANRKNIPTLTEVHDDQYLHPDAPETPHQDENFEPKTEVLSDDACQYLAMQIAPQVDVFLQDAVRDIKSRLPEIIRAAMHKKTQ